MEWIVIALVSLGAALLTFFSGFGLGTILLPAFALFFDITTAIACTAIVHFANNIFKFSLLYRYIHFRTALYFGIPAIIAAIIGSYTLFYLGKPAAWFTYSMGTHIFQITSLKVTIGLLLLFFALIELNKSFENFTFPQKYFWFGGILSGFFGGLSGHQGAFRSAFLAKADLDKQQFIATSNVIGLVIDFARLFVYSKVLSFSDAFENQNLLFCAMLFAFVGSYFGKKMLNKTTMKGVQKTIGVLLIAMGLLLISGLL